eukprot:scaffold201055_cov29-Tisochrysis_lutea.AAC.11
MPQRPMCTCNRSSSDPRREGALGNGGRGSSSLSCDNRSLSRLTSNSPFTLVDRRTTSKRGSKLPEAIAALLGASRLAIGTMRSHQTESALSKWMRGAPVATMLLGVASMSPIAPRRGTSSRPPSA